MKLIDVETVAHLLEGKYIKKNVQFLIVDCRFPYEYNGGHIKNAVNICTFSDLINEIFHRVPVVNPTNNEGAAFIDLGVQLDKLLAQENSTLTLPDVVEYRRSGFSSDEDTDDNDSEDSVIVEDPCEVEVNDLSLKYPKEEVEMEVKSDANLDESTTEENPEPSYAIIFHCEFSSQRAPAMAKFLRRLDRTTNCSRYPFLFYPDTYVMKGGYAEFYQRFQYHCEPPLYMKMFHKNYRSDLRYYRRLTRKVSEVCNSCFQDVRLVNCLQVEEEKENLAFQLRKVRTEWDPKSEMKHRK